MVPTCSYIWTLSPQLLEQFEKDDKLWSCWRKWVMRWTLRCQKLPNLTSDSLPPAFFWSCELSVVPIAFVLFCHEPLTLCNCKPNETLPFMGVLGNSVLSQKYWSDQYYKWHSFKQNWLPPLNSNQMPKIPWIELGLGSHFLLFMLGYCLTWVCTDLVNFFHNLWVYRCTCHIVPRKVCFLDIVHHFWLLVYLFCINLWASIGFIYTSQLRLSILYLLILCL